MSVSRDLAQSLGISGGRRHAVRRIDPDERAIAWRGLWLGFVQAVLACIVIGVIFFAVPWLQVAFDKPIQRVMIKGELHALDEAAIREAVVIHEGDTFLTADLSLLVSRLEQHPWIAHARVRRIWPDALEITLVEQKPIAYWGEKAMVNAKGKVFEHLGLYQGKPLPKLWSELGSPAETMNYYQILERQLEPLQLRLQSISQNVQGDWRLQLDNGVTVILDRVDPVGNARNFVILQTRVLAGSERKPELVDMRYRHGAAIRWQPAPPETEAEPTPAGDKASDDKTASGTSGAAPSTEA